jgi:CubicO group peptidase (beta-lactamase class C family)
VGSLIEATSVGAGLTRLVNSKETLSFLANATRQTSGGPTSDFVSGSIVYSYQFTREWTAQLSYRYLHEFGTSGAASTGLVFDPTTGLPLPIVSGSGPASSNSIMLVVSRSISILPGGQ